jgi:hypothetical protein
LTTLAAGVAATRIIRARGSRYPIAFSTLGCPAWSRKTVLERARRLGYSAIELRGVAGELDLTKVPELSGSRLAEAKNDLSALGLVVSDLGGSAEMHETGAARRQALDEGRAYVLGDLKRIMVPAHRKYQLRLKDFLTSREVNTEWERDFVDGRFSVDGRTFSFAMANKCGVGRRALRSKTDRSGQGDEERTQASSERRHCDLSHCFP